MPYSDLFKPAAGRTFADLFAVPVGASAAQTTPSAGLIGVKQPSTAPAATQSGAAGVVDAGTHVYGVTLVVQLADGTLSETALATPSAVVTADGAHQVSLSTISAGATPVAGATVLRRNLYRSKANTAAPLYLLATLAGNASTTYTDNTPDSALGTAAAPVLAIGSDSVQIGPLLYVATTQVGAGGITVSGPSVHQGHHSWNDANHVPTVGSVNAGISGTPTFSHAQSGSDNRQTLAFTTTGTPPGAGAALFTLTYAASHSFTQTVVLGWGVCGAAPPGVLYLTANSASAFTVACSAALAGAIAYEIGWIGVS